MSLFNRQSNRDNSISNEPQASNFNASLRANEVAQSVLTESGVQSPVNPISCFVAVRGRLGPNDKCYGAQYLYGNIEAIVPNGMKSDYKTGQDITDDVLNKDLGMQMAYIVDSKEAKRCYDTLNAHKDYAKSISNAMSKFEQMESPDNDMEFSV